jgi:hypothetical protein
MNLKLTALLFTGFLLLSQVCFADGVSSEELIKNPAKFDGKNVIYEGEAVGEVMPRQDHAWINVSDSLNAIGVWLKKSDAEKISYAGSFRAVGDTVRVEGVFHKVCLEHGGDLDIHARTITVKSPGYKVLRKQDHY